MENRIVLTDFAEHQPTQPTASANYAGEVLKQAIEKGAPVDTLERLLTLEMKYRAWQAELAFQADFLALKQEPELKILKDEIVEFQNRNGQITKYFFSPLDRTETVLIPLLAKHNFTHHWRTEPQEDHWTKVTCVIKHVLCHANDDASLMGPPDMTGSKNAHQAIGSNTAYLERYTLCAAVGITPKNVDRDARPVEQVSGFIEGKTFSPSGRENARRAEEEQAAQSLEPVLRESVKQAEANKLRHPQLAAAERLLRGAETVDALKTAWASLTVEARRALSVVKDEVKQKLQEVPCNSQT